MVEISLPEINGIRRYVTKHAPQYLKSIYMAALAEQIETGLVVPGDVFYQFASDKPLVVTISDDCGPSLGPDGFNYETLKALISASGFAAIITVEPEARFYDQAVHLALGGRINAVIIETRMAEEARWLEYVLRCRPGIMWALWTPEIRGTA